MFSFDCWRPHDDDVLKHPAEELRLNVLNGTIGTVESEAEVEVEAEKEVGRGSLKLKQETA